MKIKSTQMMVVLAGMALITAACTGPTAVERTYGDAVRSNVKAQVYDPVTIVSPSTDAVEGTDGKRMEGVMEAFRNTQGSAGSVAEPIVINVGN
jgi:type IV pilus biogenesis protein CpaD/CtpE